MIDRNNYYYEVMPFGLKNVGATHQRLIDMVFSSQTGINFEVYTNDMLVNTHEEVSHVKELKETFELIRKFDMRLNPNK